MKCFILSDTEYCVKKRLGVGAYATAYLIENSENKQVIKVQKPACPWEFYITTTIRDRLRKLQHPIDLVRLHVLRPIDNFFYNVRDICFLLENLFQDILVRF